MVAFAFRRAERLRHAGCSGASEDELAGRERRLDAKPIGGIVAGTFFMQVEQHEISHLAGFDLTRPRRPSIGTADGWPSEWRSPNRLRRTPSGGRLLRLSASEPPPETDLARQ